MTLKDRPERTVQCLSKKESWKLQRFPIHYDTMKLTLSMKMNQIRFFLAPFCFHDSKPCVMLWKCTVLLANQLWYLKGGADLFLYSRVSQGLWHIFIHPCMILRIHGPGGPWFLGTSWIWTAWSHLKPQAFLAHIHLPVMKHLAKTREMLIPKIRR